MPVSLSICGEFLSNTSWGDNSKALLDASRLATVAYGMLMMVGSGVDIILTTN